MRPANERRRYIVTSSLIGWAPIQNGPCNYTHGLLLSGTYRFYPYPSMLLQRSTLKNRGKSKSNVFQLIIHRWQRRLNSIANESSLFCIRYRHVLPQLNKTREYHVNIHGMHCKGVWVGVAACACVNSLSPGGCRSNLTNKSIISEHTCYGLTHWGRDKMVAIFQTCSNAFFKWKCMISLKFLTRGSINNIRALVQIMAWHRPGAKTLSEPLMFSLLTHICVTRPQ